MPYKTLLKKIEDKSVIVGVVGLGYVGLPFAVEKAKAGLKCIGYDKNSRVVDGVNAGISHIEDVDSNTLAPLVTSKQIEATADFSRLSEADVLIICVPTPLDKNLSPDLAFVTAVSEEIAEHLRPGQLISLESTTYPGTSEDVIQPILEKSGLTKGEDFFLAYSPERVDPGNKDFNTKNTHKIVGADDENSLTVAKAFYELAIDSIVPVSSTKAAEMVKVYENTYRAVNIALANEIAMLCDKMGINVWEMLDAAFTKPFGIMPFYPGPGVGGHCIPIDPHYLEWKAKEYHFNTRFISLAGEINRRMPTHVISKAFRFLNKHKIALKDAKILIVGMAYKKNLADYRESPAVNLYQILESYEANVSYYDPYIPEINDHALQDKSIDLNEDTLAAYDLVIIATNHDNIDFDWLCNHAKLVLDTRNCLSHVNADNLERL